MAEETVQDAAEVWEKVKEGLRRGEPNLPLWDAADTARGLDLTETEFIIGLPHEQMYKQGHLLSPPSKHQVETLLADITGRATSLEIIEGTTPDALERAKARAEATSARLEAEVALRRERRAAARGWEGTSELVVRLWSEQERVARKLPQRMAEFVREVLEHVALTEEEMAGKATQEMNERQLGRILGKIASFCDLPPTVVGLEYARLKERERQ